MSITIGNTSDLDASRKEGNGVISALQGLLGSLGHPEDNTSPDTKLSAEQVRKLSEKINKLLGDGALTQVEQPSQLLNEDGLPIIDISEPVNEDAVTFSLGPEQEFIPLSLLPPDEMERQRRERDRILDLLEEEERLQKLRDERDAEEERKEAIKKRRDSAKVELEQLKAARELQKKMGRALVQHVQRTAVNKLDEETSSMPQPTSPVAKKSVSFVDALAVEIDDKDEQTSIRQPDWGDVTPGRLRAQNRVHSVSAAEAHEYPMKMHVVERRPAATPTQALSSHSRAADSDDESPSAECLSSRTEDYSPDDEERSSGGESLNGKPIEEEYDYDVAQHHREIALEYYKKRHIVGAEAAKALDTHALDGYEEQKTSYLSHFRADRMAAAYDKSGGLVSTSLGQTVIPGPRVKSLQNSVRLGKLDDDQLVGEDSGESGSEDEVVKEVMQMLQTGSIRNAGPDFELPAKSIVASHQSSDVMESEMGWMSTTPSSCEVKLSRFRLAHGTGTTGRTTGIQDNEDVWSQPTISSVVERKAPISPPSQRFPINKPPPRFSVKASELALPMVINSPSFPSTSTVIPSPSTARPMTIGPSSSHQTPERRSQDEISAMQQDSMIRSRVSPARGTSATNLKSISKFMAERTKQP